MNSFSKHINKILIMFQTRGVTKPFEVDLLDLEEDHKVSIQIIEADTYDNKSTYKLVVGGHYVVSRDTLTMHSTSGTFSNRYYTGVNYPVRNISKKHLVYDEFEERFRAFINWYYLGNPNPKYKDKLHSTILANKVVDSLINDRRVEILLTNDGIRINGEWFYTRKGFTLTQETDTKVISKPTAKPTRKPSVTPTIQEFNTLYTNVSRLTERVTLLEKELVELKERERAEL